VNTRKIFHRYMTFAHLPRVIKENFSQEMTVTFCNNENAIHAGLQCCPNTHSEATITQRTLCYTTQLCPKSFWLLAPLIGNCFAQGHMALGSPYLVTECPEVRTPHHLVQLGKGHCRSRALQEVGQGQPGPT
jgi:hypothetical protein